MTSVAAATYPVKHHPSDAVLTAYAAGALGEGLSLLVATHLSLCPTCRAALAAAEALGGALLESIALAPMSGDACASVLARLDDGRAEAPNAPVTAQRGSVTRRRAPSSPARAGQPGRHAGTPELPAPLRDYVSDLSAARWQWVGTGVRQLDLMHRPRGRDTARLLRIAPGRVLPHHGHGGLELTVVLQGSFSDEQGRFTRGDLAEIDADAAHQPIADSGEPCICLIGTDAPLRFSGLVPRVVAPMLGF